jgi:uncharacterized protein
MRHAFVHFDLNTSDFAGVRRFYETLFDWDFVDVDMGGGAPQAQMLPPSGPSGGLQRTRTRGARSQWVPYVTVDDLRAMLARVREAGGAVIQDYVEVPGLGAQAIVQDPGGTQLGLWEMAAELRPAPAPAPEIVDAEVIEDAEIVEEASGPQVVVDAPAVVEVTVAPAPAAGGRRKRGSRRAAQPEATAPEAAASEPEAPEPPLVAEPPKRGRKKASATPPAPEPPVVAEPPKRGRKKASATPPAPEPPVVAERPAPAKKTSKAAAKKASRKAAPAKKTAKRPGRGRR